VLSWIVKQLFLDLDGVLADFDAAAALLFRHPPREAEKVLGTPEFWRRIRHAGHFYRDLPLIPDAMELYRAVKHLHPVILTGVPMGGWAEDQKVQWVAEHFPGVNIITCRAREKFLHMRHPGDVLVDDYLKYKDAWEQAGGVFVHHASARATIARLAEIGLDVRLPG
jgi:5'(3')-deoxyribonucleotidase